MSRRRDAKKNRKKRLKVSSSESSDYDDSPGMLHDASKSAGGDPRNKKPHHHPGRAGHDLEGGVASSDLAKMIKEVELKEFQKICLRRKELCKWIEHADFQKGIKGAFLRVVYHREYVIGQIEQIKEGSEIYRVEQRETKKIVTLKNGGQLKDFKLNVVSDGLVTEQEFSTLRRQNRHQLDVNQEFISKMREKIASACEF